MRVRTAVAVWTLGVLCAVGGVLLVFASNHEESPVATSALAGSVGLAFIAAGLIAWTTRPENRTGALMTLVGFTWFLGALSESNYSVPFTAGVVLGNLVLGAFVHLVLAFPSGRLETRSNRVIVAATYVLVTVGVLPFYFFADLGTDDRCGPGCPESALLIERNESVASGIEAFVTALAVALTLAVVAVLVRRWRAATAPLRRALTPVFAASGAVFVLLAAGLALDPLGVGTSVLEWLSLAALLAVPLAFLFGLVRSRLTRYPVGRLVVELGEVAAPGDLRNALARALGDPSLEVAYHAGGDVYVDGSGRELRLPSDDSGRVTYVERGGTCVGALVHDPSLREEAPLLEGVAAAASLALENERRLAALEQSDARLRALLDAIPDLMFRLSRDGTYLAYKADSERDLAAPADELIGRKLHDVLPADVAERILRFVRIALDEGTIQTVDYQLTLGGVPRYFEARIVVSGEDEVVLIVRDFTERRRTEAELGRLHAELEARLEELQASRARIVEAGQSERRRLERNLHDGAQQRLVALSLALRLAKGKLRSDPEAAERLLDGASEELALALEELRELARGIHPAVLTDRGLGPALEALATRAPLPVELEAAPEDRLPEAVETAAYFVVSEALANVAKYARASSARVRVSRDNGRAVVVVADDGVGGADPARGSGLRGLVDRVEALEGRLEVESPAGGGTTIRAEIPCA